MMFNDSKLSFETGLIQDELTEFSPLLQHQLSRRPLNRLPQICGEPVDNEHELMHPVVSPLSNVLSSTKGTLRSQISSIQFHANSLSTEQLLDILNSSKKRGEHTTLPPSNGLVPIMNFTNIPNESLRFFLSVFLIYQQTRP